MAGMAGAIRRSSRILAKFGSIADKIDALEPEMEALKDTDFLDRTSSLRCELASGKKDIMGILPEAFALVREASVRTTGLRPCREQVLGGIVMCTGGIAEMKTGEGKTLAAAFPSYVMALGGEGVHVMTVNDYLARRDAEDIGRIHKLLGLTVGCVQNDMKSPERAEAYACDVTYGTNSEFGFDYLRDHMLDDKSKRVTRGLKNVIVDEADSIMIDEARTPLIISGLRGKSDDLCVICNSLVARMERGTYGGEISKAEILAGVRSKDTGDYVVDPKKRQVYLTDQGMKHVVEVMGFKNYADASHDAFRHRLQMALHAHGLMKLDHDYVVKDGKVLIVDTFTGRIMPGRRFSDGLHQALEAKEQVEVQPESRTYASITIQSLINKYGRRCGMTGTAMTSWDELKTIYGMTVVAVPTHKPMIRKDEADVVYLTKDAKRLAVVNEIRRAHDAGQPVLVGTQTIRESEVLSKMLTEAGIRHNVLNAKNHELEAGIIAQAGVENTVTIATNMAGRGTDIKLTGKAREAGGLYVIGTERNEARRIDDQLRGRSGRQGDPGRSIFFLSMEDDMVKRFGGDKAIAVIRAMNYPEDKPLPASFVNMTIEDAQRQTEATNFGIRKNLMQYDAVSGEQRELFYAQRGRVLDGVRVTQMFQAMTASVAEKIFDRHCGRRGRDMDGFQREWLDMFPQMPMSDDGGRPHLDTDRELAVLSAVRQVKERFDSWPSQADAMAYETRCLLRCMDWRWLQHIDYMENLQQAVSYLGYGQRDPLVEFRRLAYEGFGRMLRGSEHDAVKLFMMAKPEKLEKAV